ncbi:hypothetical protein J7337_007868 [Fusarium musae]|uniref:Alpha/beta hydrolase fold-3 domain-containing protein n=1 Tax=Fusarium musae TaxID=1042133 RepID=A0A9P8DCG6_9HYPO|nr:hypothetical protein J7337_007868 [Fusarium musae]KAG9499412.1 hypothetical protein J7337_007868 [Fusarium musae]
MSRLHYDPEFYELGASKIEAQKHVFPVGDVESRRKQIEDFIRGPGGQQQLPDNVEMLLHDAEASDGFKVKILHFRQKDSLGKQHRPGIVHVHGGGYTGSSASDYSSTLAAYVSATGVPMLSVDYRLAPEHPFPVPLEDCWSALLHVQTNAASLGLDPNRIAIMGESAGGGLAAAIAILARDRELSPPLAKQILIYPMLDDRTDKDLTGGLAIFGHQDVLTGWMSYLGDIYKADKVPPIAAPARLEVFEGLAPLYLDCGGLDMFLREDVAYAQRFIEAGITTELHIYQGVPHAFQRFAPTSAVVKRAFANRVAACTSF